MPGSQHCLGLGEGLLGFCRLATHPIVARVPSGVLGQPGRRATGESGRGLASHPTSVGVGEADLG